VTDRAQRPGNTAPDARIDARDHAIALECDGLGFGYDDNRWIFRDLSLSIATGRALAVLGPNGHGKTTFLKVLLGLLKPRAGIARLAAPAAFVPQLFDVSFPFKALDMVLMGRARNIGFFSQPNRHDESMARAALDHVGLGMMAETPFDQLSGGQRQLVIFARALASEARMLILDEPTSSLDMRNQEIILGWIDRLTHDEGLTVVFTTHHPHHALAVADDVLMLFGESDSVCGTVQDELTERNLERLYGTRFVRLDFDDAGHGHRTVVPVYRFARTTAESRG